MQFSTTPLLLTLLSLTPLVSAQAAAGGGVVTTTAATQSNPIVTGPSLQTVGGSTVVVADVVYEQTFAATALSTWALGTVVSTGSIGLGTISGTVGGVETKKKRMALPSLPIPSALFGSW